MAAKKKITRKEEFRERETEQIMILNDMVFSLKKDSIALEKDLREARTLLFIQTGVLLALFGLALGMLFKLI